MATRIDATLSPSNVTVVEGDTAMINILLMTQSFDKRRDTSLFQG